MAWPEYLHHVSLHFPIAGSLCLAAVGIWWVRTDDQRLGQFVRLGSWIVFAATTAAVITGILAAPGWFGGDGPLELSHHRNMGLTVWCVALVAAVAGELGHRYSHAYLRRFAALVWCAAAFGVIGTGHWGGSVVHSDKVPWDGSTPALQETAE